MKVLRTIIASISSIVYFIILTILMTIAFSMNFFSRDYYSNIIKNLDFKTMKIADLGDFFDTTSLELPEDATVEDLLVKYFRVGGIDETLALEVINNNKIRTFIGNFIGDYVNYATGGNKPTISKEEIADIFNENSIKKLLEQSPTKQDINIDAIYDQLNDLIDEMITDRGDNSDTNTERINNNHIINE